MISHKREYSCIVLYLRRDRERISIKQGVYVSSKKDTVLHRVNIVAIRSWNSDMLIKA